MMGGPHAAWGFRRDRDAIRDARLERDTLRRVLSFARPYRRLLIGFVFAVVVSAVLGAITPILFKILLDRALPHRDRALVSFLAIGAVTLAVASAAFSMVQRWLSSKIGEGLIFDLRVSLFDHVQRQPLAFFTRTQTGALLSRMNNDVVGAQQAFTNTLGTVLNNVISIGVTLTFMFALEWRLTLLALALLPAFVIPARRVGPTLQRITRESMQLNAEMNNTITERFNVAGALIVKLFGRQRDERRGFEDRAGRVRDIGVLTALYGRALFVILGLVAAVGTAVVWWVGGNLAISGAISIGTVGAFMLYVQQIYQPLAQLTNTRVDILTAVVSFERVFEVLDFMPAIADQPGAVELVEPRGAVEFEHVWFSHPAPELISIPSLEAASAARVTSDDDGDAVVDDTDDEPTTEMILRDVSFRIEPGETVAIVGPSGAGKTTIALLLARIHETVGGSVRVDGHDVRDLTLASLHAAIGIVPQDPHLFHETIRDNLRYAKPSATDDELERSLADARILDLVRSLADGLDTVVGERGYRLSGGEKQRLAIARMLLKDPAIMVLDEATSHLDSESEVAIQRALATALQGRTAIVIAHRLSTIVNADRILVVAGGRVVEEGRHEDLLARRGLYSELYRTQLGGGESVEPAAG
jgi:ATP-binding cassette subfamily B protein